MSDFLEDLQAATGPGPEIAATPEQTASTLAQLREQAVQFKTVMLGNYALYDTVANFSYRDSGLKGFFQPRTEHYRLDHPVWLVRTRTDYSGRPLLAPSRTDHYSGSRTQPNAQIAISAVNGAICTSQEATGREAGEVDRKKKIFKVLNFGLVTANELFDDATSTVADLGRIESDWRSDLLTAVDSYRRKQAIRREDYDPIEKFTSLYLM